MFGNKAIENYTYDECVAFLNAASPEHPDFEAVGERHTMLLLDYEQQDAADFMLCNNADDYEAYLHKYTTLPGATKYEPKYKEQAKTVLKHRPLPAPRWKKLPIFILSGAALGAIIGRYVPYLCARLFYQGGYFFENTGNWTLAILLFTLIFVIILLIISLRRPSIYKYFFSILFSLLVILPMGIYRVGERNVVFGRFPEQFQNFGLIKENHGSGEVMYGIAGRYGNEIIEPYPNKRVFCFTSNRILTIDLDFRSNISVKEYNNFGNRTFNDKTLTNRILIQRESYGELCRVINREYGYNFSDIILFYPF